MLSRLELIGFKSFADKTCFEFAPGITAVVGPNGSGKSNIVDAVRWLLGEQSAKNLRGGEMTDVIFNGSSSRKSLGMAEVTMTFKNVQRQLHADCDEVQITRRVYRDGEGEYLINGKAARLKDIKDLFLGSGAGHGAYSIIEQGRVDALLSASTKDRRLIFEEAAGISRFKVKKQETLRKLEETEQNLSRVRDILQELEKQLRTLRLQAAKAQRYQEYHERLRQLRLGLATQDYRQLTLAVAAEEAVLTELRTRLSEARNHSEAGEAELKQLDWELSRREETLRHHESRLAAARQQLAGLESTIRTERGHLVALEDELLRLGQQRLELGRRLQSLDMERNKLLADLAAIHDQVQHQHQQAHQAAAAVVEINTRISTLQQQAEQDRELQFQLVSQSARHHSDAETFKSQLDRLHAELQRKQTESQQASHRHRAIDSALQELTRTDADLQLRLHTARQELLEQTATRNRLREQAEQKQHELERLREQRSDLHGRADVLEALERGLEGIGAGVRAVHTRWVAGDAALRPSILGLVADLLHVPQDLAPLVDLTLADTAQRFVVRPDTDIESLLSSLGSLPGRVGFLPLHPPASPLPDRPPGLSLAEHVRCLDPVAAHLPEQLLGNIVLAPDLSTAHLWAKTAPQLRFITRAGELLEPGGMITVGPMQPETGLFSRKSELRELQQQLRQLDLLIRTTEAEQARFRSLAEEREHPIAALTAEIEALTGAAGSLRDQILEQRQIQRQLADQVELLASEIAILQTEVERGQTAWSRAVEQAAAADRQVAEVKARLETITTRLIEAERERVARETEHTAAQVALSRVQEQRTALTRKRDELEAELRLRRIDSVNQAASERAARGRWQESLLIALRATSASAATVAEKEFREAQIARLIAERVSLRQQRQHRQQELEQTLDSWKQLQEVAHARELTLQELRTRRESLIQRLREDFGLELPELLSTEEPSSSADSSQQHAAASSTDEQQPAGEILDLISATPPESTPPPVEEVEQEIRELRQNIEKLGSVNLEALEELRQVEARERELRKQHDDLTEGRRKLQAIIDQIHTDSRRLFAETLESIRTHFQELFRKLFGGGQADIVLENDSDILESGIEIIARPPGKELRKISLLSGGEKALTAVALLLAIFRSRPSPFCLLDEVDAAMDEGNTQRLALLLKEFSDRSQFIVITHKKRTMAVADVLYGITMQESGVSKLVAVRFEDWPTDEESPSATAA